MKMDPGEVVDLRYHVHERGLAEVMRRSAPGRGLQASGKDTEFAGRAGDASAAADAHHALQCRPLSKRLEGCSVEIPTDIPRRISFTAAQRVPHGCVEDVQYIVWLDPRRTRRCPEAPPAHRVSGRRLTAQPCAVRQVLHPDGAGSLGDVEHPARRKVPTPISTTKVLVEIADSRRVHAGGVVRTHFFQDLVEANIYPPPYPDDPETISTRISSPRPTASEIPPRRRPLRQHRLVIDVPATRRGHADGDREQRRGPGDGLPETRDGACCND